MRFRVIALAIVSCFFSYIAFSLSWPLTGWPLALMLTMLSLPFLPVLWMILFGWQHRRNPRARTPRWPQQWAYAGMGFLNFMLVVAVARDILSLFVSWPLHTNQITAILIAIGWILFIGGLFVARHPRLKRVTVRIPDLHPSLAGFRIAQLSDVHVSAGVRRPFVEKIVRMTNSCEADVIALTGDIFDGFAEDWHHEAAPLAELKARHAKYYVTGNHEYYWGAQAWIRKAEELQLQPLLNTHQTIEISNARILFAGVPDISAPAFGSEAPNLDQALQNAPQEAVRILLSHQTKLANEANKKGFQLLLSGHTHGGQFFPWTLVVSAVDRFPHGLRKAGNLWVYVSRGTGFWGPPVRLGSQPEVTLIELQSE